MAVAERARSQRCALEASEGFFVLDRLELYFAYIWRYFVAPRAANSVVRRGVEMLCADNGSRDAPWCAADDRFRGIVPFSSSM